MQTIQNIFDNMEVVTEEAYKNTELLLEQYTKVMFRIEKNIVDIDYELYAVEGKHLKEMLYELVANGAFLRSVLRSKTVAMRS